MSKSQRWVWLDLEMTGLNPKEHKIIEIATVVTDYDLNIIATGPELAISQPDEEMAKMDKWCVNQHTGSGLVERINKEGISQEKAEQMTLEFLREHVTKNTSPMCGNTISQDRRFLCEYMPNLEQHFHYRHLDVTSIKLLAKAYQPELEKGFVKKLEHRALGDVLESIEELKYYTENFMKT